MEDDKDIVKYILTIEFDPDTDKVESMKEEIVEVPSKCLIFKGNTAVLDSMDDESISRITTFEIAET